MRTIAIINQKGGCGKTTVSINLAAALAAQGRKTLLVDMDPQAHCALGLAVPESQIDRSVSDLLRVGLDGSLVFSDVVWQISRKLDLAPSTMALAGVEQEMASASDKDRRLVQVLATVADRYEFCIVDCPPSIGLLTFNALRAADEVLIPVDTGYFSLQGSVKQKATIEMLARRAGHTVRFRVLATMYDVRTKLAREIVSELRKHFGEHLLPILVHFNSKLKEAASFGQPINEYDAASRGMADFDKLAAWLIANPPRRADAGVGEAGHAEAAPATTTNPAMSRAAELVERARALSARTTALAARLAADPDVATETDLAKRTNAERPAAAEQVAAVHGVQATSQGLLFVQPLSGARQVAIAGDFNGWDPGRTPLKRDERLGVWQRCVPVPAGRYRYRLVVDGQWVQDPYNDYVESNPFGELNNVVEVGLQDELAVQGSTLNVQS